VPFLDETTVKDVHASRAPAQVARAMARAMGARLWLLTRTRRYDAVIVQREATMVGPPWIEAALARLGLPLIYDIDDALWLTPDPLPGSLRARFPRIGAWVRGTRKADTLLALANEVICGSARLSDYARARAERVTTIPTVTDTTVWRPLPCRAEGAFAQNPPIVGWIGTPSTAIHLARVEPALLRLRQEGHHFIVRVRGAGAAPFKDLAHENLPWRGEHEVDDFAEIDVGLAPMEDTEWAHGKCAFKQIQYMCVGTPHVTSRAGAVLELVEHEQNGLIADTEEDWYRMIRALLVDQGLRKALTRGGFETTSRRYSLAAQADTFVAVIERAIEAAHTPSPRRKNSQGAHSRNQTP
jgi:glycosyltransferase involved in cell wall biosynthesis